MSIVRNAVLFATVAIAILAPIFVGYGLAAHSGAAIGIGIGVLAVAGILVVALARTGRNRDSGASSGHAAH